MNKIIESQNRLEIEKYIIENISKKTFEEMSVDLAKMYDEIYTPSELKKYYDDYISQGKSLVGQVTQAAKDVSAVNFDFDKDLTNVVAKFSYSVLSKEFQIIYDRILELYQLAKQSPENGSYDKRIVAYLERANQLRSFVIKDAFQELKKSVIMDVGKRIMISAITTFIPYIEDSKKEEAKNKFLSSISNLIKQQFNEPEEIKEIREKYEKETKEN